MYTIFGNSNFELCKEGGGGGFRHCSVHKIRPDLKDGTLLYFELHKFDASPILPYTLYCHVALKRFTIG